MKINPETSSDGYKVDHKRQYPEGTQVVVSNLTSRGTRRENVDEVIFFGLQYFMKEYLIRQWNEDFFSKPKDVVLKRFNRRINNYLGDNKVGDQHISDLHDLGYLPISILALPEGSLYKLRVPCLVIYNTLDKFFWLTNYLETILSVIVWGPCTSATTAFQFKKALTKFALETVGNTDFVPFQGHDFSYRGMYGMEASVMSGGAHLTSFVGTDTIPAIDWLEEYYNADSDKELAGCSVSATEHSVACSAILNFVDKARGENGTVTEDELMNLADIEYVRHLITEVYPTGIVSIVADSFDYWNTITKTALYLKEVIMARDGKVVFRPDTGDPTRVVCGYKKFNSEFNVGEENGADWSYDYDEALKNNYELIQYKNGDTYWLQNEFLIGDVSIDELKVELTDSEIKGSIECLWDIFGGTVTDQGYKVLDPHVGLIYGDSITFQRANDICEGLIAKGFASTNIVFGMGSYTYQYVTRDTDAYAVKATFVRVNDKDINIYKKPKTGDGSKNSAMGIPIVLKDENGKFYMKDHGTFDELHNCELIEVFRDGQLLVDQTLAEIRERIQENV